MRDCVLERRCVAHITAVDVGVLAEQIPNLLDVVDTRGLPEALIQLVLAAESFGHGARRAAVQSAERGPMFGRLPGVFALAFQ